MLNARQPVNSFFSSLSIVIKIDYKVQVTGYAMNKLLYYLLSIIFFLLFFFNVLLTPIFFYLYSLQL